jgi:hypothetical protein
VIRHAQIRKRRPGDILASRETRETPRERLRIARR